MTLVVAFLGVVAGLGAVTVVLAIRGEDPSAIPAAAARVVKLPAIAVERFTLRITLAMAAAVFIGAVTRWPVAALLCGVAGFVAPSLAGGRAEREGQIERVEAIAGWAEMLRDTMAGAGGLEQSIIATAGVAPTPIRGEVLRLAARLERDRLAPALRDFADELDDPTGDLVVAALLLAADKSPKRLGALLGTLAASARGEVNMRMRVETGRARTRTSVRVVTTTTVLFAIGLIVLNRSYLAPYDSAVGQLVMAMVGACFATSFVWLARSSRVASHERFLADAVGA
ncbi:MAG: pilus assembly protein TadB [Acidimicrobiales bacterium]